MILHGYNPTGGMITRRLLIRTQMVKGPIYFLGMPGILKLILLSCQKHTNNSYDNSQHTNLQSSLISHMIIKKNHDYQCFNPKNTKKNKILTFTSTRRPFFPPQRLSHRFSEGEVQSRRAADAMRSEALVFGHLQGWKV